MSEFYKELYEELYSKHGYHKDHKKEQTQYPFLFDACLNPADIKYKSVLDIGCSTGLGIKYFFEPLGVECKGIDVSPTAVSKAIDLGVDAQVACMTDIPFEDNSFELVCSADVVEHLKPEDQEQAHRECFRVSSKYVAHKISTKEEQYKFLEKKLHLTIWSHSYWIDFFKSLKLNGWKLIHTLTEDFWENIKEQIHASKRKKPTYKEIIKNRTVVLFEKIK
jgi:SAM-dependent methyltransferase